MSENFGSQLTLSGLTRIAVTFITRRELLKVGCPEKT